MSASPFDDACPQWRRSTYSTGGGNDCVEVARVSGVVGVRDSKNPSAGRLQLRSASAHRLFTQIRAGQFDR